MGKFGQCLSEERKATRVAGNYRCGMTMRCDAIQCAALRFVAVRCGAVRCGCGQEKEVECRNQSWTQKSTRLACAVQCSVDGCVRHLGLLCIETTARRPSYPLAAAGRIPGGAPEKQGCPPLQTALEECSSPASKP